MVARQQPEVPGQAEPALVQTIRLLARLAKERFFGKVTINFQDGKIMLLHKEESIKPTDLAR